MNSAIFNFRRYVYEKPSKSVRYDHLDPHSCCCGIHFRFDQQDPRPLCRHAAAALFSACDSISHRMDCALYFNGHIRLYDQPVGRRQKSRALSVYALQLFFNFFWSILFFRFSWYLPAFFWLAAMIVLILIMIFLFFQIKPLAAYLQIPYLFWCLFAAYLNFGVYWLN